MRSVERDALNVAISEMLARLDSELELEGATSFALSVEGTVQGSSLVLKSKLEMQNSSGTKSFSNRSSKDLEAGTSSSVQLRTQFEQSTKSRVVRYTCTGCRRKVSNYTEDGFVRQNCEYCGRYRYLDSPEVG